MRKIAAICTAAILLFSSCGSVDSTVGLGQAPDAEAFKSVEKSDWTYYLPVYSGDAKVDEESIDGRSRADKGKEQLKLWRDLVASPNRGDFMLGELDREKMFETPEVDDPRFEGAGDDYEKKLEEVKKEVEKLGLEPGEIDELRAVQSLYFETAEICETFATVSLTAAEEDRIPVLFKYPERSWNSVKVDGAFDSKGWIVDYSDAGQVYVWRDQENPAVAVSVALSSDDCSIYDLIRQISVESGR